MNLVIDKPFRDARSSTLYKEGDVVVQSNTQIASTWMAIGIAHEMPALSAEEQAEVTAEVAAQLAAAEAKLDAEKIAPVTGAK